MIIQFFWRRRKYIIWGYLPPRAQLDFPTIQAHNNPLFADA